MEIPRAAVTLNREGFLIEVGKDRRGPGNSNMRRSRREATPARAGVPRLLRRSLRLLPPELRTLHHLWRADAPAGHAPELLRRLPTHLRPRSLGPATRRSGRLMSPIRPRPPKNAQQLPDRNRSCLTNVSAAAKGRGLNMLGLNKKRGPDKAFVQPKAARSRPPIPPFRSNGASLSEDTGGRNASAGRRITTSPSESTVFGSTPSIRGPLTTRRSASS